ncbi:hypothetical protein NVI2019_GHJFPKLH_00454 [Providencia alcalifaciens]|nr:hypothetical protein NVI2019_GHJFPKLH_00454 [Providencia alcalifaciens]
MVLLGCKINKENQFIDFRLITQSGKNHAFIPLCHQPTHIAFGNMGSGTTEFNYANAP